MNKDNAHLYLPLVKALAEGKEIQGKPHAGDWRTLATPNFTRSPSYYRIKPDLFEGEVWVHTRTPQLVYSDSTCGSSSKSMLESGYRKIKVKEVES